MNYANSINDHLPALRGRLCFAMRRTAGAVNCYPAANKLNHRLYLSRSNGAAAVRNDRSGPCGDRFSGAGCAVGGGATRQPGVAVMGVRSTNYHDARPFGQTLRSANRFTGILGDDAGAVSDPAGFAGNRNRGSFGKTAAGWTVSQLASKLASLLSIRQVKS